MKNFMNKSRLTTVAGLLATAILTGCGYNHGEQFADDAAPTRIGKFAQAQASAGAKEDATLYDVHFHGAELTSLGQGKLDLLIKGTPCGDPVTIWLNVPHDTLADRSAMVRAYLKKAGVPETNMILAEGPNPNLTTPTAYNLGGLYAKDGASFTGQATVDTGATGTTAGH